jgi:hypothetical protein
METPDTNAALAADAAAAIDRIRELLTRIRRQPEPASGWIMRQERTSPLDTRYVAR